LGKLRANSARTDNAVNIDACDDRRFPGHETRDDKMGRLTMEAAAIRARFGQIKRDRLRERHSSGASMIQEVAARTILVSALALSASVAPAKEKPTPRVAMICVNPASGTKWRILIDFSRSMVDANPAEISADAIAWHDAKDGGNYTLDRASGALSATFASSTGGYILRHRCLQAPKT
jgi:hypothetical protein